jgi:hypothetical protein
MNNTSGSAWQKVGFVLVLFVAAALGYLVVRERIRADRERAEAEAARTAAEHALSPAVPQPTNPPPSKTAYAPLRPRAETNVVRALSKPQIITRTEPGTNRTVVVNPWIAPEPARTTPAVVINDPQFVAGEGGGTGRGSASVTGRVLLRGTPPPEKAVILDAMSLKIRGGGRLTTRHYVVGDGGGLADVFVYIKAGAPPTPAPAGVTPLLDQVKLEYQPYVIGVQTGQVFMVRNSDPLLHNVHIGAKLNRERNIGMPTRGFAQSLVFDRPEVFVQFKCDVHPWEFAYVGVVSHPWFAVTDKRGEFALPTGLPPGDYTIAAVHRKAGEQTHKISVRSDGADPVTFNLNVPDGLATAR